jgi:Astacin (Peptidase family M12A)
LNTHPGTTLQQNKVKRIVEEWQKYANITFKYLGNDSQDATIRIQFDPNSGSWSYTGHTIQNVAPELPTMNLGIVTNSADDSAQDRGSILHEFGHVLGLHHDQVSPIHGKKLTLKAEGKLRRFCQMSPFLISIIVIIEFHRLV